MIKKLQSVLVVMAVLVATFTTTTVSAHPAPPSSETMVIKFLTVTEINGTTIKGKLILKKFYTVNAASSKVIDQSGASLPFSSISVGDSIKVYGKLDAKNAFKITALNIRDLSVKKKMAFKVEVATPKSAHAHVADMSPTAHVHTPPTPPAPPTPAIPPTPPIPPTGGGLLGNCTVFPADNPWNRDVSNDPVDPNSNNYINSIGSAKHLHPDFGWYGQYGFPVNIVNSSQPKVDVTFNGGWGSESDPGPYPIPPNAKVEGGSQSNGDRHVLVIDKDACMLYELYQATYLGAAGWNALSAAKFDLKSNALRPDYWTSADAAGLPIFPGLARADEAASGVINHALRFTVSKTQRAFIHPATHFASPYTDPNLPPMGLRLRLKANFDTSKYTGEALVILTALKKYGMIVADNGSDWFISGTQDPSWVENDIQQLKSVPGSAFEVVKSGPLIK